MLNISSNKLLSNDKSDNDELSFEKFQGSYRKIVSKNRDDKNIYEEQFDFIDNYHQIKVCPEPLTFLHELIKRNSFEERENYLKKQIEKKGKIIEPINDIAFTKYYWNNQTTNGVNLRPGLKGNLEVMYPLRLDDSNVHGLISGVTGSGKSVLLNTMIMNLLYEYPSWELDLFLVDFKKVEFSRYLSLQDKPSPSVNAVGATEEVSYVVSLIKYIYDVMNAREMLFSKLNQTHIKGFREKYDVVLPRVVLIVDEFQQMFLEASNKETAQINEYLTAITKKGRATGIHLLFASQEMSNTLPQNVKMNFQLRMVLPCTKEVSIEVLGNSAGATLEAFHMLANKGSRNAENNIKFLIPFIDTAKEDEQGNTVFVNLLEELKKYLVVFLLKSLINIMRKLQQTRYEN